MKIIVNDQPVELPVGATISALLEQLGMSPRQVAVERNKALVRRSQFDQTCLEEDDRLEIVSFVGGG